MKLKNILLSIITLLCFSCEDEKEIITLKPFDNAFEDKTLKKFRELTDEAADLWSEFNTPDSYPIYLIFIDDEGNTTNGYIINPPTNLPSGSEGLDNIDTYGFNMVKNNFYLSAAIEKLGSPFRSFTNLELENEGYFVMRQRNTQNLYDSYKDKDDNWLPTVLLHEIFHIYQLVIQPWNLDGLDFGEYELNEDVILYHLLLFEIMSQAYAIESDQHTTYLKMYVAIWDYLLTLDNSGFIESRQTYLELIEGSARYIEHFSALNTVHTEINEDPTHSWSEQLRSSTDGNLVNYVLTNRMWYHTGAAATHILKELGADVEKSYTAGITPYLLAKNFISLSDAELAEYLEQAKDNVDWEAMKERSVFYASIIN